MVIGILRFTLYLPENGSLKGKRRVLRSVKDRLRSQFNVSVAEVEFQDLWQKAGIAVVIVSPDRKYADGALQKILNKVDSWNLAELMDVEVEII